MSDHGGLDPGRLATATLEFSARTVELGPGQDLRIEAATWADEIVFLTSGEIEIECRSGAHRRFDTGAVICLSTLPLARVRSVGAEPARLLALSRRARTLPKTTG